jgi:hypothetical protein
MKPEVELKDNEKSKVVKVYRKYYRGKWYESETPQPGYNIVSYYATKVTSRLYYSEKEMAQERAEAYNKRLRAQKKGQQKSIDIISWYDFNGTELQNEKVWWHDSGSWLYTNHYDDWDPEELLQNEEDVVTPYDDYQHTTVDFFEVLFTTPAFSMYELKEEDGRHKIFIRQ